MKPIRNFALTLAALGLLAAPLAGCGSNNAMGPEFNRPATVSSDAQSGGGLQADGEMQPVIADPGTPDKESSIDGSTASGPMYSGSGHGKPKKAKKPKNP